MSFFAVLSPYYLLGDILLGLKVLCSQFGFASAARLIGWLSTADMERS